MKRVLAFVALTSLTACSYMGLSDTQEQAVLADPAPAPEVQAAVEPAGPASIKPPVPHSTLVIADAWALEAFRNGDMDLLGKAMTDTLHQPYRLPLIRGAQSAMEAAKEAGADAVALSGAGPRLIAFSSKAEAGIGESMKRAFEAAGLSARIFNLGVSGRGAEIQIL